MYPLIRELAVDGIPGDGDVAVLKLARQPYYRWLGSPVGRRDLDRAYLANAVFDAHYDDPVTRRRLPQHRPVLRHPDPALLDDKGTHAARRTVRVVRRVNVDTSTLASCCGREPVTVRPGRQLSDFSPRRCRGCSKSAETAFKSFGL